MKISANCLSDFYSISLPMFVKDVNGNYIDCNEAFEDLLGKKRESFLNTSNKDDEYLLSLHNEFDKELLHKDAIKYKEVFALKTQKSNVYEFHKSVIKENDKYNGYICIMIDVMEYEREEHKLQWLAYQEVEKNKEILRQHEEEKLAYAKFTAIGQLAAGITHEINTPLTYIKGNLEMLKMDLEDMPSQYTQKQQLLEDVDEMYSGIERIASIVTSMREMSQQKKVQLEKTNIYSTLITALIMAHNRSKQICKIYLNDEEFTLDTPKDKYEFYANIQSQRIEQAWIVIINNALDELQKKDNYDLRALKINISQSNSKLNIKFSDNAGGISEEIIEHLFEPFVSKKPEGGMGVGLSIAKRILDEQNGSIEAYNENGGAVFEIVLMAS